MGNSELLKSSDEGSTAQLCTNNKDSIVAVVRDYPSLRGLKKLNSEDSCQSNKSGNSIKGHTIAYKNTVTGGSVWLNGIN